MSANRNLVEAIQRSEKEVIQAERKLRIARMDEDQRRVNELDDRYEQLEEIEVQQEKQND